MQSYAIPMIILYGAYVPTNRNLAQDKFFDAIFRTFNYFFYLYLAESRPHPFLDFPQSCQSGLI